MEASSFLSFGTTVQLSGGEDADEREGETDDERPQDVGQPATQPSAWSGWHRLDRYHCVPANPDSERAIAPNKITFSSQRSGVARRPTAKWASFRFVRDIATSAQKTPKFTSGITSMTLPVPGSSPPNRSRAANDAGMPRSRTE